jgi:hypothetical protein
MGQVLLKIQVFVTFPGEGPEAGNYIPLRIFFQVVYSGVRMSTVLDWRDSVSISTSTALCG